MVLKSTIAIKWTKKWVRRKLEIIKHNWQRWFCYQIDDMKILDESIYMLHHQGLYRHARHALYLLKSLNSKNSIHSWFLTVVVTTWGVTSSIKIGDKNATNSTGRVKLENANSFTRTPYTANLMDLEKKKVAIQKWLRKKNKI